MEEVRQESPAPQLKPPGFTLVALPYQSKSGFVAGFVQSLAAAIMTRGGISPGRIMWLGDHSISDARNAACESAIHEGAEYLWFIDSDMDFPADALPRLKACNADIACADMWSRGIPSFRTVMRTYPGAEQGRLQSVPVPDEQLPAKGYRGVEDIDVCGMACTLIRVDFLKRFKEHYGETPWFWVARHGEDAMFCFNAKEIGATIRCDFGVETGHWGVMAMRGQDFTRDARNQPMSTFTHEPMMRQMGVLNLPTQEGAVK